MKKLVTLILLMTTMLSFGQGLSFKRNDIMNKIDLKLPLYQNHQSNKDNGAVLIVAGILFTSAALLEGSQGYSTSKSTNYYTSVTTTPSFWQQTPRQLMVITGVGLTLTGGVLTFLK